MASGSGFMDILKRALGKALQDALKPKRSSTRSTSTRGRTTSTRRTTNSTSRSPKLSDRYPGDFKGKFSITYDPHPGKLPDPGEVVWSWVPYEEDHNQGKERPVLLLGRDGDWLLGLPLTSKDHDRDGAQEQRQGRYWIDIGTGPWDSKRRPSEARVDRVIRVNPNDVRGAGEKLSKAKFDTVAAAVRRHR